MIKIYHGELYTDTLYLYKMYQFTLFFQCKQNELLKTEHINTKKTAKRFKYTESKFKKITNQSLCTVFIILQIFFNRQSRQETLRTDIMPNLQKLLNRLYISFN